MSPLTCVSGRLHGPSRRELLTGAGVALGAAAFAPLLSKLEAPVSAQTTQAPANHAVGPEAGGSGRTANEPFGYCLNTSTINNSTVPAPEQFEIAARAGFGAVEPWIRDLENYQKKGGSMSDLAKRVKDLGLQIPSAIGFAQWIVDDDAQRAKGLEQMKHDMDLVAQVGGTRIAAPPIGANNPNAPELNLHAVAERYRAVLELGDKMGVVPELEIWGPSKNLHRLGEAALVAIETGHPKACILADIYHLYKGGSEFGGLALLSGNSMHCLHANDYPADPPRDKITDAQRVYPGDGIAPLGQIFHALRDTGYRGWLSLELFNRDYWKLSPQKVAQTGIEKLRAAVQKAFA